MTTETIAPSADATDILRTADAIREQRELGRVSFTLSSKSTGNLTAESRTGALFQAGNADESRIGRFTAHSDEPMALLGTDKAMSPAEYILVGLAGCYMVTIASLAALKDIQLESVELTLGFDIDLAGFLGVDDSVRRGAQQITVDVAIESPGTDRVRLSELVASLEATSPIRDTLANAVSVVTRIAPAVVRG